MLTFTLMVALGFSVMFPSRKTCSFTLWVFSVPTFAGSRLPLYWMAYSPPPRETSSKYARLLLSAGDTTFISEFCLNR